MEKYESVSLSCCPLAAWIESAPSCSVMLSPWLPFRSALVSMNRLRLDMMCAILIVSNHFCVRLWRELGRHVKLASLHDVIQLFLCVLLHKIVNPLAHQLTARRVWPIPHHLLYVVFLFSLLFWSVLV